MKKIPSDGRRIITAAHHMPNQYATNWQVAGSIPDGVIGIFQ
jgi:hypothetical protein